VNIEVKVTKLTDTAARVTFYSEDGLHFVLPDGEALRMLAAAAIARHKGDVIGDMEPWKLEQRTFDLRYGNRLVAVLSKAA
jgi:hypothetical protein